MQCTNLDEWEECGDCRGTGENPYRIKGPCPYCKGEGVVRRYLYIEEDDGDDD